MTCPAISQKGQITKLNAGLEGVSMRQTDENPVNCVTHNGKAKSEALLGGHFVLVDGEHRVQLRHPENHSGIGLYATDSQFLVG
jgi:hypothetical protein